MATLVSFFFPRKTFISIVHIDFFFLFYVDDNLMRGDQPKINYVLFFLNDIITF